LYFGLWLDVVIPSSIGEVLDFCMCSTGFVKTIVFEHPSRVLNFGVRAFDLCEALTEICIPASVQTIHGKCFRGCKLLATVSFEHESELRLIDDLAFASCCVLPTITIPASVERIGQHCFTECFSLRKILFESPSKLSQIGDLGNYSVDSIDIPDSVQYVGRLPGAPFNSSCIVAFERGSQLMGFLVGAEEFSDERVFARYSEASLRCWRNSAMFNADP
jgi:hypothetical protein